MAKQTNPTPAPERASTSDVTFTFVSREGGPERLVCEAELMFPQTAGILGGLKLVGFSLWRSPESDLRDLPLAGVRSRPGATVLRLPASRRRGWRRCEGAQGGDRGRVQGAGRLV